jgi:hypothetical protein
MHGGGAMNYRRTLANALQAIRSTAGDTRLARKDTPILSIGSALVAIDNKERLARAAWVQACRQNGHTWAEIAEQLGTTRQNAQQTYGDTLVDRPLRST